MKIDPASMCIICVYVLGLTLVLAAQPSIPRQEQTMTVNKGISKTYRAKITGYCPCETCCGEHSDGKTAIGNDAKERGCAVDPTRIPYGTILEVPGYGLVRADDTGSAMRSYEGIQIDLRFLTHAEALEWGVKEIEVSEIR